MAAEPIDGVLQVANATRRYRSRLALDDVSLSVRAGEVYALIGHNGAGKSTLAKAALGALALDSGTVRVLGQDPHLKPEARKAIGVAPQEIGLYPHLSVAENLEAFGALAGLPRSGRKRAVADAMRATSCAERANERLDRLSGGWRRRANLAAAIVHAPRLLILDEPTEGLDSESRIVFRTLIDQFRRSGVAILLISHDTQDVAALADRVGVLQHGRMVAEGAHADLVARAFGTRRELVVRLAYAPEAAGILTARGLSPSDDGEVWTGLVEDALARARELEEILQAAGLEVSELTVRPPGLDALLTQAEAA